MLRGPEWDLPRGPQRKTEEQRVFCFHRRKTNKCEGTAGQKRVKFTLAWLQQYKYKQHKQAVYKHQTKAWGCSHEQETVLSQQGWRPSKLASRDD